MLRIKIALIKKSPKVGNSDELAYISGLKSFDEYIIDGNFK
jgi:hypothetical protein